MNKKEKIKDMRRTGYSYREIVKALHVSKRDITKLTKGIKFSKEGKQRYYSKVTGIIKPIKKQNKKITLAKTRIIGHLLFDGSLFKAKECHYTLMYVNASRNLVRKFYNDIKKVYNVKPSNFREKGKLVQIYRVKYNSKKIYNDLLGYTPSYSTSNKLAKIPISIIDGTKRIKIEFLRTFWDDEGCISKQGALSGSSNSYTIIRQLAKLHEELGFRVSLGSYISKRYNLCYRLRLSKKNNSFKKFYNYKLFTDSIAAKGSFIGVKKINILKQFL